MIQISRRSLIRGLGALIAAPAVIRVASLMPIKVWDESLDIAEGWIDYGDQSLEALLAATLRRNSRLIAENITNNNALLARLKERGLYERVPDALNVLSHV
jgi:hypothetical protein